MQYSGNPGSVVGCDLSGVVVKLGEKLNTPLKIGDRVATFVRGGLSKDEGSFADYARAESDLVWKIPDSMSFEIAANYGVPWFTTLHVSHFAQASASLSSWDE